MERIKKMAAEADDVLRNGDIERSETFVRVGYGRLRETWERGVEEAILNETVVRFRPGVATQRLRAVVLDDEDYVKIHEAMARCSHFAAHDTSADANTATPTAAELRADVETARVFFADRRQICRNRRPARSLLYSDGQATRYLSHSPGNASGSCDKRAGNPHSG
ncbi:UNVERIFIED_ORG: hypothetical protein J2Y81_008082 [Paraburkholderia sediminicola]|nr:hypothetical protein [Paraburkholderia sediminicola]